MPKSPQLYELIQFRLSERDAERAHQVLERSSERNLNMLAKRILLDFLDEQGGQSKRLDSISEKLDELTQMQQEVVEHMRGTDPGTTLSVMCATFLLMYRSVNASARAELDAAFQSDAVINFLKQGG